MFSVSLNFKFVHVIMIVLPVLMLVVYEHMYSIDSFRRGNLNNGKSFTFNALRLDNFYLLTCKLMLIFIFIQSLALSLWYYIIQNVNRGTKL